MQQHIKNKGLILLLLAASFFCCTKAHAQSGLYDTVKVYAFITLEGDTIPGSFLPDVYTSAKMPQKWKQYWAEWTRLRNAVYVTYPYAKAAGRIMNDINGKLVGVKDKRDRKRIIREREKELKKEFTDKLTNLSVYQGKVLMKLINRETGNNCYEIIQEYKGGFTAGFWQTVAVVFGSSLKQGYDKEGADKALETIVKDVARMYGHSS